MQPQYILALETSCFAVDPQVVLALYKQKTKHCVSSKAVPCYVDVAKTASLWGNNKAFRYLQYKKVGKAWYLSHVIFKWMLPGRRNSTHFAHAMFSHHGFRTLAEISYIIQVFHLENWPELHRGKFGAGSLTYYLFKGGEGDNCPHAHKWEP